MAGLFGGRNARASTPTVPLPSLNQNVQTSLQGRARTVMWGTAMVAGNIIDLQDFTSVLVANYSSPPNSAAGKGGHTTQPAQPTYAYTYYATVVTSLCEGPISSVNAFTGDGLTMSTFGGGTGGGTVFLGNQTQTAWSYMTSRHPANALAYRGEAYIGYGPMALGSNTAIPNFKYEITASIHGAGGSFPLDANARDVVSDFLTNDQYGVPGFLGSLLGDLTTYANYSQAAGLVVSPVLSDQTEAGQFLRDITEATNSELVWSNGLLTIVPYGDVPITANGVTFTPNVTPVYTLDPTDFIALNGGSSAATTGTTPIAPSRKSPQERLNTIRIEYLDRSQLYIPVPIEHKDEASIATTQGRPSDVRPMHFFCLASAASMSAALQLTRQQVANTYSFTLPKSFILLDPMDLVSLPLDYYNLSDVPQVVRIKEIQENADYTLTFIAEDFLGIATAPLYARQGTSHGLPDFNVDPGAINPPVLFEMPDAVSKGLAVYAAVSGGANYGGSDVYTSTDGVNYVLAQQIKGNARMGVTTAILPTAGTAGSADLPDLTNTLSVDLTQSGSTLGSGTLADMLSRATLCYVGGELVAYDLATLTGANRYNLAPLLRGAYGSTISAHASGVPFVRVDGNVVRVEFEKARAGRTVFLKFVPFNLYGGGQKSLADATAYSYKLAGTALSPEDVATFPLDDAANSDFVGAVNEHKEATAALRAGAVATAGVLSTQSTLVSLQGALATFAQGTYVQFGFGAAATLAEQTSRITGDMASGNTELSTVAAFGATDFEAANKDFIDGVNSAADARGNFRSAAVALAGVKSTQDALTTASGAIASFGQQAYVQFGQLSASIQINATALANAAGSYASLTLRLSANDTAVTTVTNSVSTINGTLAARYTLDVNINGKISGFSFIAGGASSTFAILATSFTISSPGLTDQPMFTVGTVNGATQITVDGTKFPDLGVLNRAIESNGVSNSTSSSGLSGQTGTGSLTVRAGSRVRVIAYSTQIKGVGGSIGAGSPPTLRVTVNGSTAVEIPIFLDAGSNCWPQSAFYTAIAGSAGTWTASALARYFSNSSGNVNEPIPTPITVEMQEFNK